MDASGGVNISHNLGSTLYLNLRSYMVIIRDDAGSTLYELTGRYGGTGVMQGGIVDATSTQLRIERLASGIFDSTSFDSTSYNRGWINIEYVI
jgi:hypothetical protein